MFQTSTTRPRVKGSIIETTAPYFLALLAGLALNVTSAQPVTLDISFGNAGIALTDIASSSDVPRGIIVQPDGKVLIAGSTTAGSGGSIFLARYLENGDPDPDFGVFGKVTTSLTNQSDAAMDLVKRPDGRSLAVGFSGGGNGITAVQYLADGTVDVDFGTDGVATFQIGSSGMVRAGLTSTGQLICAARNGFMEDWRVVRFNPDGQLDPAFGEGGSRYIDASFGQVEYLEDPIVLADDRTLLIGTTVNASQNPYTALGQLTPSGDLDPTFAIDGTALIN